MSVELSNSTIGMLSDGAAGLIIDAELKNLMVDLDDRGSDGKPRVLTIKVTMIKKGDSCDVLVDTKATMPPRKTNRTVAGIEASGKKTAVFFSPDNAGNPKQPVIPGTESGK